MGRDNGGRGLISPRWLVGNSLVILRGLWFFEVFRHMANGWRHQIRDGKGIVQIGSFSAGRASDLVRHPDGLTLLVCRSVDTWLPNHPTITELQLTTIHFPLLFPQRSFHSDLGEMPPSL